jgi:hypothetical protein
MVKLLASRLWQHSAICLVSDKNWNISAVRSPNELKLGGDLELVSQISVHVLVSRFDCFSYCKQTIKQKNRRNREKHGFRKLEFSPPIDVKPGGDIRTSTRNSVVTAVCLFCLYYCLFTFRKHKQK